MDKKASVEKLVKKGVDRTVAEALVEKGIITPSDIRKTAKVKLKIAAGLNDKKVTALKKLFELKQ